MKPLFRNYNFEFSKNDKKILITFSKQVLKQIQGNNQFFQEERAFNSILEKLNQSSETVKLTKDEYFRIKNQLNENVKFLKKEIPKVWFIKKWLYKSLVNQYSALVNNYFSN